MKAWEILRSNFKHYRFVIYKEFVKNPKIDFETRRGNKFIGAGCITLINKDDLPNHYDIGYSGGWKNVNQVAYFIDSVKIFKIDRLEYVPSKETLYIHCKLNEKKINN